MYHAVVRSKLRRAFAHANAGEWDRVLDAFHPTKIEHVFFGDHALGGRRTTMTSTRAWYARLEKVFPDLQFDLRSIVVVGWPWKTRAIVEWTDRFTVDGKPGRNQGVHVLRMRWGRVVGLEIHCDTARLVDVLRRKVECGVAEAGLPPIEDAA